MENMANNNWKITCLHYGTLSCYKSLFDGGLDQTRYPFVYSGYLLQKDGRGLLEYYDAVGFELERAIALNVYPDLCDTKSIQKTTLVGIASGRTGQKAGQGLYDWSEKDEDDFRYRKQAPYFEGVRQWHMPE